MDNSNSATLASDGLYTGDAVDVAIKNYLKENNLKSEEVTKITELPFDSKRKMMSAVYKKDGETYLYLKGSLEAILQRSTKILINNELQNLTDEYINQYKNIETQMSEESLKVIAFAYKKIDKIVINEEDYFNEEKDLILTGLAGYLIKNINKYKVYARVSPETKVQIVKAFQKENKVVAMTGDGVNDAPAIKLANVGVGMGKSGTDVTKDVSDIILLDDSFNTIVTAVSEGRRIYDNVISNILYNLSSNFTEILIILFGMLTGNTIISAIHVLYIDLVADTVPSIALAFEGASKNIMKQKPNGLNKKIFTKFFSGFLILSVILETLISLYVYYRFLPLGQGVAQTLALLSIVINEFVFAYNCRSLKEQIHKKGIFKNKQLNIGILALILVQIIVFFSPIGKIFGLEAITVNQFIYVIIINLVSLVIIELLKPLIVKHFKDE